MGILARSILGRFFWNFLVLFTLLFTFGVSIDVILHLDRFLSAGRRWGGEDLSAPLAVLVATLDFHGPRIFQFYAYMVGLVSVAAAAFTLATMLRARELTAILAAGVSLHRVATVFLVGAAGLNLLQLVNQELVLPRLAPLLVREVDRILEGGIASFPLPLTRDGRGRLLAASSFDPATGELADLLVVERDGRGEAIGRLTAARAAWDPGRGVWILEGGERIGRKSSGGEGADAPAAPIAEFATDLSPEAIRVRKFTQYAQMLSLSQIRRMREQGGVDPDLLARLTYVRLGAVGLNLLVLAASLPFFLRREPANLLQQGILCAAFAVPATLGSLVAMNLALPGLPPAVAVFLPAVILLPVALARLGAMRT
jgi:lipopolysaccharide export LptBFGC system permease protein LptF